MPPNAGRDQLRRCARSRRGRVVSRQIGNASTPANSLNRQHLPSITGIAARGPMSPRPSTARAVGDDRHGVALDRVLEGLVLVVGDRQAHARHARACRPSRGRRASSAGACCAVRSCRRRAAGTCGRSCRSPRAPSSASIAAMICSQCSRAGGVDDDVAHAVARRRPRPGRPRRRSRRPRRSRSVRLPEHAVRVVELDADREAVLRAGRGAHWRVLLGCWAARHVRRYARDSAAARRGAASVARRRSLAGSS